MICQIHLTPMQSYSPPAVNGIVHMIALYRCPKCDAEREAKRDEQEMLAALRQANGIDDSESPPSSEVKGPKT